MPNTITPEIVNEIVTVAIAPTPSSLQQSGAVISVGGTTLTTGSYQYITQASQLAAILSSSGNFAELTNMVNSFFAQGTAVGVYVLELGANVNVVDQINSLQTWIADNPRTFYAYLDPVDWDTLGEEVGSVSITNGGTGYTSAPVPTFTAATGGGVTATGTSTINGSGVVTSVTITNPGYYPNQIAPTITFPAPTSGTTATGTVNMANALALLAASLAAPSAKTYFFQTTTTGNVASYQPNKSVAAFVNSPTAPSTEFTAAAEFYNFLVNNPSASNPLLPINFRYVYGVTPWPMFQNSTSINTILSAYANLILTGAEGGISNALIRNGTMSDGSQAQWWYGVDWMLLNIHQAMAAAIINGSNGGPICEYDQPGINFLQSVGQKIANDGIAFKCALSATVNATPFYAYTQANPDNYQAGLYNGFSVTIVGKNGFTKITIAIDVLQFVP